MTLKTKITRVEYNEATLILLFLYLGITFFSVALSNICLGISGATFLLGVATKQINLKDLRARLFLAIITPFILTIISTLNSSVYDAGIGYLNIRLPILVVPFMVMCLNINKKQLKKAFTIFLIAAILASINTFYNAIKYYNEDILFQTDFAYFITVIHHPYFGVYLLLAILGLLEYNIITNKYIKVFALIILSLAIALTTSRMVYVLYFIAAFSFCYAKLPTKKFRYAVISLGVLGSILLISNKNISNKFTNSFNYDKSPRLKLWANSLEAVNHSNNYIFGIGIGDFYEVKKDVYFGEYYGAKTNGVYGYNPHSLLVEFYVTNGLFGLFVIGLALIYYLFKLKSQNLFALSVFTIVFLFSLVECIFNRQYGVQLYSVIIPLLISHNFRKV